MASSVANPLQPRGPMASLYFWDSMFPANLTPSWHFFRQDDVYSESKCSVWSRICLGVGYVSEPIGNTCRTLCNVSGYTALNDVTPLSLWRQLTEQETWQSTMCSHTAEAVHRFSRQILSLCHSCQCLDTLPLRLFDRFCSLLSSAAMPVTSIYINGTYTGWLKLFGQILGGCYWDNLK